MRTRTKEVYEALCEVHKETGNPPTIRQIAGKLNLTKGGFVSVVFYALQDLVDLGLVEKRNPIQMGLYVPVLPPDEVDWEALEKGNGDERETLETDGEGDSGVLRDAPDSPKGG